MSFEILSGNFLFQFKVKNKQGAFHLNQVEPILKNSLHEMGVNET